MEASGSQDRAREARQAVATAQKPRGQKAALFASGVQEEKGKEGGGGFVSPLRSDGRLCLPSMPTVLGLGILNFKRRKMKNSE